MLLFYPPPDLHARPANSACRIIIAFRLVRYTPYTSVAAKVFPFPFSLSSSLSLSPLCPLYRLHHPVASARDPTRSASAFTDPIFSRDHAWNDDGVHLSGGHFSARRMAAECTCNRESLVKTCGINFSARRPGVPSPSSRFLGTTSMQGQRQFSICAIGRGPAIATRINRTRA